MGHLFFLLVSSTKTWGREGADLGGGVLGPAGHMEGGGCGSVPATQPECKAVGKDS